MRRTSTSNLQLQGFQKRTSQSRKKLEVLTIEGKIDDKDDKEFVHRGLASRSFKRTFTLSDEVLVSGASMENGILSVALERVIPEEKKPIDIEIS